MLMLLDVLLISVHLCASLKKTIIIKLALIT